MTRYQHGWRLVWDQYGGRGAVKGAVITSRRAPSELKETDPKVLAEFESSPICRRARSS